MSTGNSGNRTTGERHHRAKLTNEQVAKIRRMYKRGLVGYQTLAAEFGVAWPTIRDIVTYRTRPI